MQSARWLVAGTEAEGPLLTDEDRTLLERWKSIYSQSSQSIPSDDSQSTLSTSDSVDRHSLGSRSPHTHALSAANQNDSKVVNQCLQGRGINSSFLSNHVRASVQPRDSSVIDADRSAAGKATLTSLLPSAVAFHGYLLPAEIQPGFTTVLAPVNNSVQCVNDSSADPNRPEGVRGQEREVPDEVAASQLAPPSYSEALQARTLTMLPTTTPLFTNSAAGLAVVNAGFLHHNELSQADAVPARWICEEGRQAGASKMGEMTSLLVGGQISTADGGQPSVSGPVVGSLSGDAVSSSDDLRVITSRLNKSHVDLTLRHTPRGSGAGYGVGCHDVLQLPFAADLPSSELRTGQER